MAQGADIIFDGGSVLTLADEALHPRAVAVRDGSILALGSSDAVRAHASPSTTVVDLSGKCLMHGFIDAHTHLVGIGVKRRLQLDLGAASSLDELLSIVAEAASRQDENSWIIGRGWDESLWSTPAYPCRVDLDRSAPRHPVALARIDGHFLSVNSKALEAVGNGPDSRAIDDTNGWVRDGALGEFQAAYKPSRADLLEALVAEIAHAHSLGITGVHEICDAASLDLCDELSRGSRLRMRTRLAASCEDVDRLVQKQGQLQSELLSLDALKIVADGSIGARTAALTREYADDENTSGAMNFAQVDMARRIQAARERGFQAVVHAIGDRAIAETLGAFEAAGVSPRDRARIEHCELPSEADLHQMRRMGIIASMQPNFLQWSGEGQMYERRLGLERESRIDPHRSVLDADIALAFGSDHMPLGPLLGIDKAVNAPHASQRVSVAEALRAYTSGSAYAGFTEAYNGTLKPGNRADLIVLSGNPLGCDQALDSLVVEQTYVGGQKVFG